MDARPDHYFTAAPASPGDLRALSTVIAGREVDLVTASGVFSPDRMDAGTRVLLRAVPDPPSRGPLLDLGCGWGPLALTLATLAPHAPVWGVDVNQRSVHLLRRNATRLGLGNIRAEAPQDVPTDLQFTAIWSNPPIRVGKPALHALLLHWLPRLAAGAQAHLVVQRNLGSDSLQRWLDEQLGPRGYAVSRSAAAQGFRVLQVTAPG